MIIRAAIGDDQHFSAGFFKALSHITEPHILTDHNTEANPFEGDRAWKRAWLEHPHFIEHAVIGELGFVPGCRDFAVFKQADRIVKLAILHQRARHQHRRTTIQGKFCKLIHRFLDPADKGRL